MDRQDSKQGIKNHIYLWQKIILKGNYCILSIEKGPRCQKVQLHTFFAIDFFDKWKF